MSKVATRNVEGLEFVELEDSAALEFHPTAKRMQAAIKTRVNMQTTYRAARDTRAFAVTSGLPGVTRYQLKDQSPLVARKWRTWKHDRRHARAECGLALML